MLHLVLDNTIINSLCGQSELSRHDLQRLILGLKRKTSERRWDVTGSVSLIEEILGVRDAMAYEQAISLFWDLTRGRLFRPDDDRVSDELWFQRPLAENEVLLDTATVNELRQATRNPEEVAETLDAVRKKKLDHARAVREIAQELRERIASWHKSKLRNARSSWRTHFDEDISELYGVFWSRERRVRGLESSSEGPSVSLQQLHATRACLSFLVIKVYEDVLWGIKPQKGDRYDMCYYIDAVPGRCLVTDDQNLIMTCFRIPRRGMAVLRLKSLAALLQERRIAQKLRRR